MDVSEKVKQLIWKALNNILPTQVNLHQKRIIENRMCPICCIEEETVVHALWNCLAVSDVWVEEVSPINKWQGGAVGFMQLWTDLYSQLPMDKLELVAFSFHKVWARRNAFVFDANKFKSPTIVMKMAVDEFEEFKIAQLKR